MFHFLSPPMTEYIKFRIGELGANADINFGLNFFFVNNFGLKFVHTLFFKEVDQFVMEEAVKSLEKSTVTH